jgi:RNA polymerase sigma-70 factor (ECF subfamily)
LRPPGRRTLSSTTIDAVPPNEAIVERPEVMERARQGDGDAFAALVDTHLARLDATARLILRDPDLARDAVQECLFRAWRDLPRLREPDRFEAWLYRLTVNACYDLVRRRRRQSVEVELAATDGPSIDDHAASVVEAELIHRALGRLDAKQRAVVALHYLVGMPLTEVATTLGIPVGTAKSRLHQALTVMRATVPPRTDPTAAPVSGGQLA